MSLSMFPARDSNSGFFSYITVMFNNLELGLDPLSNAILRLSYA